MATITWNAIAMGQFAAFGPEPVGCGSPGGNLQKLPALLPFASTPLTTPPVEDALAPALCLRNPFCPRCTAAWWAEKPLRDRPLDYHVFFD